MFAECAAGFLALIPNGRVIKKKEPTPYLLPQWRAEKQQTFIITDNQQIAALRMKPEVKVQTCLSKRKVIYNKFHNKIRWLNMQIQAVGSRDMR